MGCCCRKLEERINELFEPNKIIAKEIFWANLEYQRSVGCCQTKGSGVLVLTSDVLWFNLFFSDTQIVIPLRSILAVRVGRIPGEQALGLIVDYVDQASGMEDQVIFSSSGPQRWKMLIEAAKGNYFGELERRVSQRFVECRIIAKEIFWANLAVSKISRLRQSSARKRSSSVDSIYAVVHFAHPREADRNTSSKHHRSRSSYPAKKVTDGSDYFRRCHRNKWRSSNVRLKGSTVLEEDDRRDHSRWTKSIIILISDTPNYVYQ